MSGTKAAFVFVHGGWVCSSIWGRVVSLLEAGGHVARALDLPGSAVYGQAPLAYDKRPLDAGCFRH